MVIFNAIHIISGLNLCPNMTVFKNMIAFFQVVLIRYTIDYQHRISGNLTFNKSESFLHNKMITIPLETLVPDDTYMYKGTGSSLIHLTHLLLDIMAAISADNIFKCIFLIEKFWILNKIKVCSWGTNWQ